jgi:hypothetical protein
MWISFTQNKLEILAETENFISIDSCDSGINKFVSRLDLDIFSSLSACVEASGWL